MIDNSNFRGSREVQRTRFKNFDGFSCCHHAQLSVATCGRILYAFRFTLKRCQAKCCFVIFSHRKVTGIQAGSVARARFESRMPRFAKLDNCSDSSHLTNSHLHENAKGYMLRFSFTSLFTNKRHALPN